MHTIETIKKTQDSYLEAISRIIKDCGPVKLDGSGYAYYLGSRMSILGFLPQKANDCRIRYETLIELGKPRIIIERSFIYRSDFFDITFMKEETYKHYYISSLMINYEDSSPKVNYDVRQIYANLGSISWGLKNWDKNVTGIRALAERCNEKVKEKISTKLKIAQEEVENWKQAQKKQAKIVITI